MNESSQMRADDLFESKIVPVARALTGSFPGDMANIMLARDASFA